MNGMFVTGGDDGRKDSVLAGVRVIFPEVSSNAFVGVSSITSAFALFNKT
jgi:hypothetical protein